MNRRIEELVIATDAWCDQNLPSNWTDRVDEYLPVWNAKFAELIVRSAMDYASRNWEHGHLLAEDLRVYFGVEE